MRLLVYPRTPTNFHVSLPELEPFLQSAGAAACPRDIYMHNRMQYTLHIVAVSHHTRYYLKLAPNSSFKDIMKVRIQIPWTSSLYMFDRL